MLGDPPPRHGTWPVAPPGFHDEPHAAPLDHHPNQTLAGAQEFREFLCGRITPYRLICTFTYCTGTPVAAETDARRAGTSGATTRLPYLGKAPGCIGPADRARELGADVVLNVRSEQYDVRPPPSRLFSVACEMRA
jgi:hypothetical protein